MAETETATAAADDHDKALDSLAGALADNARDQRLLARRIGRLQAGRAHGESWQELLAREGPPATPELSTRILRRLSVVTATLRRTLARGLRSEGASIPAIAKTFGVSHQRVSSLLRR